VGWPARTTAPAATAAGQHWSIDADQVAAGLVSEVDEVLAELESAAGWTSAQVKGPVVILGSFNGILTTVRNQVDDVAGVAPGEQSA
jgi:hypothetical protein